MKSSEKSTMLLLHDVFKRPWREMSPRIHGHDLVTISPLRERPNAGSRVSIGKIGPIAPAMRNIVFCRNRHSDTYLWSASSSLLATARA